MEKLEHFRHILLFEFHRGAKDVEAARNIWAVYGDSAIGESTGRKFSRFKEDRFDIDTPRSGRTSGFDEDRFNTLIHNDSRQCTEELANVMNCDHRATFAFSGQGSKIGCMSTACSKPQQQKSAGGHMCISACSSSIGS